MSNSTFAIDSFDAPDGSRLTTLQRSVDGVPDRFTYSIIEGSGAVASRKQVAEQAMYDFDPSRFMEEPNAAD